MTNKSLKDFYAGVSKTAKKNVGLNINKVL